MLNPETIPFSIDELFNATPQIPAQAPKTLLPKSNPIIANRAATGHPSATPADSKSIIFKTNSAKTDHSEIAQPSVKPAAPKPPSVIPDNLPGIISVTAPTTSPKINIPIETIAEHAAVTKNKAMENENKISWKISVGWKIAIAIGAGLIAGIMATAWINKRKKNKADDQADPNPSFKN